MKVICIGRNYTDHIEELANEKPSEPVVFLKPDTAILLKKQPFFWQTLAIFTSRRNGLPKLVGADCINVVSDTLFRDVSRCSPNVSLTSSLAIGDDKRIVSLILGAVKQNRMATMSNFFIKQVLNHKLERW